MKLGSPFPYKKARIEIIPLIDIMFFLLASFMLASLALIRLQAIRMDLPTGQQASKADPALPGFPLSRRRRISHPPSPCPALPGPRRVP